MLTGETGAGKSLLIDSLELLRGARGSSEMIRAGSEKMSAEAVFHLPSRIADALDAIGIDVEPSGDGLELIVKRELATNGRGRVLVNGSPVSVRELGEAMDAVLEIHGQHESQNRVAGLKSQVLSAAVKKRSGLRKNRIVGRTDRVRHR